MNKVPEAQNRPPLRIKPEAISYLASLPQFHGLHTARLIKLAHRRTGLHVPGRWLAISLIRSNLIPIPVADRSESPQVNRAPFQPRAKLILVQGNAASDKAVVFLSVAPRVSPPHSAPARSRPVTPRFRRPRRRKTACFKTGLWVQPGSVLQSVGHGAPRGHRQDVALPRPSRTWALSLTCS